MPTLCGDAYPYDALTAAAEVRNEEVLGPRDPRGELRTCGPQALELELNFLQSRARQVVELFAA